VSKDIELHRNPTDLKNGRFSEIIYYFLHFIFFRRLLHTVEVRGSSPLSPTILFNNLHTPQFGKFCVAAPAHAIPADARPENVTAIFEILAAFKKTTFLFCDAAIPD
jgi:hypothetical protein